METKFKDHFDGRKIAASQKKIEEDCEKTIRTVGEKLTKEAKARKERTLTNRDFLVHQMVENQ